MTNDPASRIENSGKAPFESCNTNRQIDSGDYLDAIVDEIRNGKAEIGKLLEATRDRLVRLASIRMSTALKRRVDPEDIVQETWVTASKRFAEYLAGTRVPVFVWLRGLAIQRMVDANRFHLGAAKRAATREEAARKWIDQSTVDLLNRVQANDPTPSQFVANQQRGVEIKKAIQHLPSRYRDVLILRFFESLSVAETASTLDTTVSNAKVLQFRALKKLEEIMTSKFNWQSSDRIG